MGTWIYRLLLSLYSLVAPRTRASGWVRRGRHNDLETR